MNLHEFVFSYGGEETVQPLMNIPSAKSLYDTIGSETHTEPLIATIFWQIFIYSASYFRTLTRLGVSPLKMGSLETIIVGHGTGSSRFDLVVLEPERSSDDVVCEKVEVNRKDLLSGWSRWQNTIREQLSHFDSALTVPPFDSPKATANEHFNQWSKVLFSIEPELAIQASETSPFWILIGKAPQVEYTACPSPAWGVATLPNQANSSTGAAVRDSSGSFGVTASFHALKESLGGMAPMPGAVVDVNGNSGIVVSVDSLTDSCFIDISSSFSVGNSRGHRGPLSGKSPRLPESVTFDGIGTGLLTNTYVTGWNPNVPLGLPYTQQLIYTNPDTNVGDSGSAIVNDDDFILGFAIARTGIGEAIEHSAWIWADSVFRTHGLSII